MRIEDDSINNLLKLIEQISRAENPEQINDQDAVIKKYNDSFLKIWSHFDLPVNYKNIIRLVNYLNKSFPLLELPARQEAFALMLKNNLPLIRELIDGIAVNLSKNYSLTGEINKHISENTDMKETIDIKKNISMKEDNINVKGDSTGLKKSNLNIKEVIDIKKELIINLNSRPEILSEELKNYPAKLNQTIQLLAETNDDKSSVLFKYLLGQQLLNTRDNFLLGLELPLFFPRKGKTLPAYLQITREKNRKKTVKSKKEFRVKLIISLEKRGTIHTDLNYNSGQIGVTFKSSSPQTLRLIEKEFNNLQKKLEQIGLKVKEPVIKPLTDDKTEKQPVKEEADRDNFIHIDLRV